MKKENHMTPINAVFMIIAVSPYLGMKFGFAPILLMAPLLLLFSFKSYQFYLKKSKEKNISYLKVLEEDLPDMSPNGVKLRILEKLQRNKYFQKIEYKQEIC